MYLRNAVSDFIGLECIKIKVKCFGWRP